MPNTHAIQAYKPDEAIHSQNDQLETENYAHVVRFGNDYLQGVAFAIGTIIV